MFDFIRRAISCFARSHGRLSLLSPCFSRPVLLRRARAEAAACCGQIGRGHFCILCHFAPFYCLDGVVGCCYSLYLPHQGLFPRLFNKKPKLTYYSLFFVVNQYYTIFSSTRPCSDMLRRVSIDKRRCKEVCKAIGITPAVAFVIARPERCSRPRQIFILPPRKYFIDWLLLKL